MNKIVLSKSEEILIDAIIKKIKPFNKLVEAELRIKENELKMSAPDFQRIRKFLEIWYDERSNQQLSRMHEHNRRAVRC